MSDNSTPVYEPGEYCEVCGGTERLGSLTLREVFTLTCCVWCHEDDAKLQAWLAREMEAALEADPNAERLPGGKWRFKDSSPVSPL